MDITEAILKEAAVGPRVTLEQVEGYIASEHCFTAHDGVGGVSINAGMLGSVEIPVELGHLTICVLVLRNGYTVLGQSVCADPANFNPQIGRELARKDAVGKIWPLLGFELRSKLALVKAASPLSGKMQSEFQAQTYLGTKVIYAAPMTRLAYNELRGWTLPADEVGSDEGFLVEYADGGRSNVEGFTGYVSWSPKDVFERSYSALAPAAAQ